MITENRQNYKACSSENFATVAGLQFCGEMSFPNASQVDNAPYFPLTGPSTVSVALLRKDSHKTYKIFAKRVEVRILCQISDTRYYYDFRIS